MVDAANAGRSAKQSAEAFADKDIKGGFVHAVFALGDALGVGLTVAESRAFKRLTARSQSSPSPTITPDLPVLGPTCFAAGTMVRTPNGFVAIDQIEAGDVVLSRNENEPADPIVPQQVVEVRQQPALLTRLTFSGRSVETTADHPMFVQDKGWTAVRHLAVGDVLLGSESDTRAVSEEITVAADVQTVYNITVKNTRTYFVGGEDWEFDLWVHNDYEVVELGNGKYRAVWKHPDPGKPDLELTRTFDSAADAQQWINGSAPRNGDGVELPPTVASDQSLRDPRNGYHFGGANDLQRPYLRSGTRQEIEAAHPAPNGQFVTPRTGQPIAEPHFGHRPGYENRRLQEAARQKGLTQSEFNDFVNDHRRTSRSKKRPTTSVMPTNCRV